MGAVAGKLKTARPGRQRDILEVFTRKVATQGYDETSLSEIARDLNLSKGTIMYHYGSKDRLLRTMSLEYMQRRTAELELIHEAYPDPVQRLASIVTAIVTGFRDDGPATRAFSREFMRFVDDPVMEDVRVARERYLSIVRAVVDDGAKRGRFRASNSLVVSLQILGMCNWGWTWLDPDGALSVEEIAEIFVETFLKGLCAKPPRSVEAMMPEAVISLRREAAAGALVAEPGR